MFQDLRFGVRMLLKHNGFTAVQNLTVVFPSIALGLSLAIACTRMISSFLYGLSPTDPVAISLSMLLLILVAIVACYLPARRATQVDPLVALRHE